MTARSIVISPYPGELYGYTGILRDIYQAAGFGTISLRKAAKRFPPFFGVEAVCLNWFDEANRSTRLENGVEYLVKCLLLNYWRLIGVRIIVFVHNKMGHNTSDIHSSNKVRKLCCDHADKIVVLCKDTNLLLQDLDSIAYARKWVGKISLIPHCSFSPIMSKPPRYYGHDRNLPFTFLFVGNISRYKNIELIFEVAHAFSAHNLDASFVIAGGSSDNEYLIKIKSEAESISNVVLLPGYLSDEDMRAMVVASDILILPFDEKSSLNSGTCVYAYTYGRNTISPRIGTVKEYPDALTFNYVCGTEEKNDHIQALFECAYEAYTLYKTDYQAFCKKEIELQEITNTVYSQANALDLFIAL